MSDYHEESACAAGGADRLGHGLPTIGRIVVVKAEIDHWHVSVYECHGMRPGGGDRGQICHR
ncbi:hypothetical protein ABIH81_04895 [Micromonospora sp. HUAS YX12]|uniref:Uncharacterized protein n=1 Tax=Micromonospora sp. HUAS YX12 TaxID=3156396 RepID=A0AAU7RBB7_9ACTN